jgi:hypothetical protein
MAYQFQTITYKDFGMGINTKSSPNDLAPGFSESLINVEVFNASIGKRRGYQGYAGWLPLRVTEVQHTADEKLKIFFDGDVSLVNTGVSPIVMYGHLSNSLSYTGTPVEFVTGSDLVHYYSTFSGSIPYTFSAPSGTATGFNPGSSSDLMLITQRNTLSGSSSSSWFMPESYAIEGSPAYDASVSWNGLVSDIDVFVSSFELTGIAGKEIVSTYATTAGTYSKTISIVTLDNLTPVVQFYYDDAGDWIQFVPDSVTLDTSLATVTVVTNFPGITTVKALIVAPDSLDVTDVTVPSGGGSAIVANAYSFFIFTCYTNNQMIIPDAVEYDSSTGLSTYTFSSVPSNTTVTIAVIDTNIQDNFLTVDTPGDTSVYTDTNPQLTVWGLNQNSIYDNTVPDGAKVMHIDSYKRESESRVMAGINGVLLKANTYDEAAIEYLYGNTFVTLEARTVTSVQSIGPAFVPTASTAVRTNGLLRADNISADFRALATGVSFVSAGVATYQLSLTTKVGTLAACLSTSYDYLTVSGFARAVNNGTFKIVSVDDMLNTITVENDYLLSNRYDESGALGRAGVFTDRLSVIAAARFLPEDLLYISSNIAVDVQSSDNTTILVKKLNNYYSIPASTKIYGRRTSTVVPVVSADNFVCGDMLSIAQIANQPRIKYINPDATLSCTVTSNGTSATITSAASTNVKVGMSIILMSTANYQINGEYVVTSTLTTSVFTIAATWTVTALAASIIGPTLQLDQTISMHDDSSPMELSTADRWIPLEIPLTTDTLPSSTAYQHMPSAGFTNQSIVRSTVIADNMYYTNGQDPVLKFDGTNVYRAGIQYWAAQLFSNVDTAVASIPGSGIATAATRATNVFTVALGTQALYAVGNYIVDAGDNAVYTIVQITTDGSNGLISVDRTISHTTGSHLITLLNVFKYYFRLNALDANNNVIAGAATGLDDYVVYMSAAGQIKHKVVGLPNFAMYNYDSLDIEIYRTTANSSGPYYRVGVLDMNFNKAQGYLEFTDATADDFLTTLDPVNTSLLGVEVGTAWSQPLRAKYMTSMSNKLILMNITGYPQIDATLRADNGPGSLLATSLLTKTVTLRKDSNDSGTSTNMVNRAVFEFVSTTGVVSSIVPAATSFTVNTGSAHGLVAKDWVYLYHTTVANNHDLTFAGWYQVVTAPTGTSFTVNSGTTLAVAVGPATDVNAWSKAATASNVPVFVGTDGNYAQTGANILNELTAIQRLANAINATMRMTDTTLTGQTSFTPWISAAAGTTQGPARLVLRQDLVAADTFEFQITSAVTGASWYVDGTKRAASTQVQASTPIFPSRVLISYENYPEIFDSPDLTSAPAKSVVDINASDGEEVTGGLPFFGSATFSAAQQEQLLIVFKQNSIYVVDITTGNSNKLRSRGIGCTAPYTIAPSRDGIMFANNSGMYKLDKGLNVTFAGVYVQSLYQDEINTSNLANATATHYAVGTAYKISLPLAGASKNSVVLSYNYQNEEEKGTLGAWTEFTNHPATGWSNLGSEAYFSTSTGSVYKIRSVGDSTDYRDDGDAVAEMVILLRAEDFGQAGIRKSVPYVTTHMQMKDSSNTGTQVSVSYDLQTTFESAGTLDFVQTATSKLIFARASMPRHKANYLQIKYTNSTIDEAVILAGVDYTVSGLSYLGVTEVGEDK